MNNRNIARMHFYAGPVSAKKQEGAVLALGLIIIVLLTMIGMTSMRSTVEQQRMAGNTRDIVVAFEATEAALRVGEQAVLSYSASGVFTFAGGQSAIPQDPANAAWDNTFSQSVGGVLGSEFSDDGGETADAPRYFAQEIQQLPLSQHSVAAAQKIERQMFRVMANGVGGRESTRQILQTTVSRMIP